MSRRKWSIKGVKSTMALVVAAGFGFSCPSIASAVPIQEKDSSADVEKLAHDLEKFAQSLEKNLSKTMESYGSEIEQWAEKYSAEMEKWGEKYAAEMEQWAEKYSGEFEKFGAELEKKFSHLEKELRNELEDSDSLKEAAGELKIALSELGGIAENAFANQLEKLQKHSESGAHRGRDKSEAKGAADRKAYLADRIEEIKIRLKSDLPEEERQKLGHALVELNDLRASLKNQADASEGHEQAIKDPAAAKRLLIEKLQNEKRRHEEATRELQQELNRVQKLEAERARKEAERAQLEAEKARREAIERAKQQREDKIRADKRRTESIEAQRIKEKEKEKARQEALRVRGDKGDEKESSELDALRAEISRLRQELDEIRKNR